MSSSVTPTTPTAAALGPGYECRLSQTGCHFIDISLQYLIWSIYLVLAEQRLLYQPHTISS